MTSQSMQMQRIANVVFALFVLLTLAAISGCGGDEQQVIPPPPGADVYYTYPYDGQTNVSTTAKMVVRVSSPVTNAGDLNAGVIQLTTDDGATLVPATAQLAPGTGERSIIIQPDAQLAYATDYRVQISGLETENGTVDVPDGGFDFTTGTARKGPKSVRSNDADFVVTRKVPDGDSLQIMDFSAFRFQFSQPVNEQTVEYGNTVTLEGPDMTVVDAAVVTRGRFITVDPLEDLEAGRTYTLRFTAGLESAYGDALQPPFDGEFDFVFVPQESGPTEKMTLNAPAGGQQSPLTGDEVNLVPVVSTLIDTESQQGGDLTAELAFVPNYPEATPIRVPRGTTLTGDALAIKLGGQVDVGFDSGELGVELITDASGYLLPNPYSDQPNAPRLLRMFMDIGVRTGNATAHAGFSQDVLHLEVVGKAIVEDGVLKGDGLTVVEPDILGVDQAAGMLSFRMNAYRDQNNAPAPIEDTAPPFVKSWMPGPDHVDKQRPGDPILINFNQPLSADSLDGNITVRADGAVVSDVEFEQEGAVVIVRTDLDYGMQYDIELGEGLTDLSGNALVPETLSFTMPTPAAGQISSPFVHTTYPGYPCVTTGQDLAGGHVGRCLGGMSSDDRLPIPEMPANRAIRVHFSHPMDEASFTGGSGFVVEELDASGNPVGTVSGQVDFREQEVRFMPDEPWQQGTLYRYTLASNGQPQNSSCDPAAMICSESGLPLKTRRLAQDPANAPAIDGGGPDMEIVFRGAPPRDSVFAHLDLRNTADLNGNGIHYTNITGSGVSAEAEGNPLTDPDLLYNSIQAFVESVSGAVSDANVGCPVGESCDENKFSYLKGALNVEIIGFKSATEAADMVANGELRKALPPEVANNGGVLFYAYPTMVQASNLVAYAETSIPGTTADPADTGPMILRVRHQCDARASATDPNPPNAESLPQCEPQEQGWIESWIVQGEDGPIVISTLDNYMDAPYLEPTVNILGIPTTASHNVYSLGLAAGLKGPVSFFDDGRMQIVATNQQNVDATMEINASGFTGSVTLRIPAPSGLDDPQGLHLGFLSEAPRR